MDNISPRQDTLRFTPTAWERFLGAGKIKGSTIILATNSTVDATTSGKVKGSTQNRNEQNASHGSTIGAASFEGSDESKTKESAVSEAAVANTGGQDAKVSGSSEAKAKNSPTKNGLPWWLWAIAAAYVGLSLWRKSINPVKWFV